MSVRHLICLSLVICFAGAAQAASCVWKVTAPDGGTLYLGGSVHALRKSDYPLPPEFLRAFEASTHLAFEVDVKALEDTTTELIKAGQYPKGDSLKNHVDPRTYAYVRRLFHLLNIPEETLQRARPWMIVLALQSASLRGLSHGLGVDQFLMKQAKAKGKPMVGLETAAEHARVYSGLSDRDAEILLLVTFIPDAAGGGKTPDLMKAWRRGDVDALEALARSAYAEFPAFGERLLAARNRAWLPKIEGFLQSGKTYFVIVGAGHLGGSAGLLTLLRERGYQVEQL
ncbi:MAG TPA: TraB/GumN family protein [Chthoniobacterales bacterium]|nr:TraB/GumN family protein [Chthoniobacterales bacterium]